MILWIQSILAVVAALVSAFVVVAAGEAVGHAVFPVPAGVDLSSHDAIRVAMNQGGDPARGVGFRGGGLGDCSTCWRVGCRLDGNSSQGLPRDHFSERSSWPQRSPCSSTYPIRSGCGSRESSLFFPLPTWVANWACPGLREKRGRHPASSPEGEESAPAIGVVA